MSLMSGVSAAKVDLPVVRDEGTGAVFVDASKIIASEYPEFVLLKDAWRSEAF